MALAAEQGVDLLMQLLQALQLLLWVQLLLHLLLSQVSRQQPLLPCCWTVHDLLPTEWLWMQSQRSW